MNKYLKLTCRCCGWFTHEANPEHPHNIYLKYMSAQYLRRICERCENKHCSKCQHRVHSFLDILIVDPLIFELGEG